MSRCRSWQAGRGFPSRIRFVLPERLPGRSRAGQADLRLSNVGGTWKARFFDFLKRFLAWLAAVLPMARDADVEG